jgi:hypothetical protein
MPSIVKIDNFIEIDNVSPSADLTLPSNIVKTRKDYRAEVV